MTEAGEGDRKRGIEEARTALGKHALDEVLRLLVEENEQFFFYVHDAEGVFTYVSPSVRAITGREPEDWQRHYSTYLTDNPLNAEVARFTEETLATGKGPPAYLVEILHSDGKARLLEVFEQPIERGGAVVGICGLAHDVSKRAEEQRAREQLEQELQQARRLESIGRLAGGVAHDFNNLLTVIIANTQLVARDPELSGVAIARLQEISDAAQQAAHITKQLLAVARKQLVRPTLVRLNEVLVAQKNMLRRLIGEDIELELALGESVPRIRIDETQLVQILFNLSANARDAMPTGGKLRLETTAAEPERGGVLLRVTDTGQGMSEETQERVFEPFFTTKDRTRGTGLGLASVHGAMAQCGGSIAVVSAPERGSTFELWFPAPEVDDEADARPPPRAVGGIETVLVVEDSVPVAQAVRAILEAAGYRVLVANDGDEALAIGRTHAGSIDLLLCDIVLPGRSGLAVREELTRTRPDLPTLFMSGYTDDERFRRGLEARDVDLIQKPFSSEHLLSRVREFLDR